MVDIAEILTVHDGPGRSPKISVMYFGGGGSAVEQAREDLETFWTAVKGYRVASAVSTVSTSGKVLDSATGNLVGYWTDDVERVVSGTGSTPVVADATQALVQWLTDGISGNRRVRGRTFIPSLSVNATSDGNLSTIARNGIASAAQTLISAQINSLGVWSRPVGGSGGSFHSATGATVWEELATQRRRRG